ncbi:PAS domain S-box protein [Chitinibacter sp. GC72]|uniref:PAS domain-containing hybrid sensor histidine kinase/response regulator n=1 Tax=Chitinibacter sp. GC72 TaxID=1526917 RepID=UPI0018E01A28|nr:PAS domain S-box protein [Chitinibacter sp. GC72]
MKLKNQFQPKIHALIVLVAVLGISATLIVWRVAQGRINDQDQLRFTQQTDVLINTLQLRIHSLSLGLRGARSVPILTNGNILPHQFRRYMESRDIDTEFPGALGFGFIRKLAAADLSNYVQQQQHYRPDFTVKSLPSVNNAPDDDYFIIEFIEPLVSNRAAVGLNIASEAKRKAAAVAAMKTGNIALTEGLQLVQSGKKEPGFLILLPYYLPPIEGGQSLRADQREENLIGWVYAPILASKLMAGLEKYLPKHIDFEVYAGFQAARDNLLYDLDSHVARTGSVSVQGRALHRHTQIKLGGQTWTLVMSGRQEKSWDIRARLPEILLLGGLSFTTLLVLFLLSLVRTRNQALGLAKQMSHTARQRELQMNAVLDSTPDSIILADQHGQIVSSNQATQSIFGYDPAALIGRNVSVLMPEEIAQAHQAYVDAYQYSGQSGLMGRGRELWGRREDGSHFPVEITLNQFEFDDKKFLVAQVADISQRYAAEQALREKQKQLSLIVECSGLGTWDLNLQDGSAVFGGMWGEMLGLKTSALIPDVSTWRDLVHPQDLPLATAALNAHITKQSPVYSTEMRMKTVSGGWWWVLAVGRVYEWNDEGQALRIAGIHLDIDARKQNELILVRRETELARLQGQLSSVVNAATEVSIIATDTEGLIQVFSPGAEKMLGYSAHEVLYRQSPAIFHLPDEIVERARIIREKTGDIVSGFQVFIYFAKQGVSDTNEWTYICKDGSSIQVRLSVTAILDDQGQITGYLGVAYNITEQRSLNLAMAQAKEQAELASQAKSDFLANMSHEIRTPMNAVIGFASLLADTVLTKMQQEFVASIQQSGDALLSLINDLLDFSKIEAGHLELERIEFDLRHTLEGAVDIVSEKANSQMIDLACLVDPLVPEKLIGDPARLRQIMLNLLNNAIKFTHQGEVVARVSATLNPEQSCRLRITVKDSGIGLSAENQLKLFKPFTQADSSTTRRFGGTGLGLSICKRLVEAMGGEIGVESEVGQGALFWFEVNLGISANLPNPELSPVNLRGLKALVVDDFAANRELVSLQLSVFGMQAICFSTPNEALEYLSHGQSELVLALVDMQLPDMDGLAFARAVHAMNDFAQLPLILLTSMAVPGMANDAKAAGYSAFLTKPIRQTQLSFAIEEALKMQHLPTDNKPLLTVHVMKEQIAAKRPYLLLAEDNPINQKVAVLMLEKLGCRTDVAPNGRIALEAVQNHRYDMVLMDCQMPEMDGFTATKAIRDLGQDYLSLPIVALTANVFQSDIESCMQAGMNDFISKPVRAEELQRLLIKWIIQKDQQQEPSEMDANLSLVVKQELADIEKMLKELNQAVGMDMRDELLDLFLPTLNECLAGLEINIPARDAIQIVSFAHKLKGAAGQLGAARISQMCRAIELDARNNEFESMPAAFAELKILSSAIVQALVI